jgi:hypothetical protein
MKPSSWSLPVLICLLLMPPMAWAQAPISDTSQQCIDCHTMTHPGIVEEWRNSRHAAITVKQALEVGQLGLKVSSQSVPEALQALAVGCAECHTTRPEAHTGTFEHNGFSVHAAVSPPDCATCHATEAEQYSANLMAHARSNLIGNALYRQLEISIIGQPLKKDGGPLSLEPTNTDTQAEACYHCHGTHLTKSGVEKRETSQGEMEFPVVAGWPNQGVGRINTDGSKGACSACHTRHAFSIEMARKPDTCRQCHVGPDVPASKVFEASKHGNIYAAMHQNWNFTNVPWTIGKDISAPTCAVCHISLMMDTEGEVVSVRTHRMNDRLPFRIYGLIYAHRHPLSPDTTVIVNSQGQPLPTDFNGLEATPYLITEEEAKKRSQTMQGACMACHGTSWVKGHWARFENTIQKSNATLLTGTRIMQEIWQKGLARGLMQNANPFDEAIEKKWIGTWLFYANSVRFASAMAGGGDYGVYADGRYQLLQGIAEMDEWLRSKGRLAQD